MSVIEFCDFDRIKEYIAQENTVVVTDSNVFGIYSERLRCKGNIFTIPAGEDSKCLSNLAAIAEWMLSIGCDRKTTIIALGGGVVGDLGGFVASSYMRGVGLVQVPTTLLAMVDSSIGGKTGVNLSIKNAIGSFYNADKILINTDFVKTLPDREIICGLGEIIKTAMLNKDLFETLSNNIKRILARDEDAVIDAVRRCAAFKAGVVAEDFKESGRRKILNVGHTLGHALETADDFRLSHGEYVLNGMLFEQRIFKDEIENSFFNRVEGLIGEVISPIAEFDVDKIVDLTCHDKKNSGGKVSFINVVRAGETVERFLSAGEVRERLIKCV